MTSHVGRNLRSDISHGEILFGGTVAVQKQDLAAKLFAINAMKKSALINVFAILSH